MLVTRKSMVSGKTHTLDLPITAQEAMMYEAGALIQDAFPNCTPAEREFYKTGITDEEWKAIFPPEEEDSELSKLQASVPSPEDGRR